MPMGPAEFIALVAAGLQAIQTWVAVRDRKRATQEFTSAYQAVVADPQTQQEAEDLRTIVPPELMDIMVKRADECTKRLVMIMKEEEKYFPQQVEQAEKAWFNCICSEIGRIYRLNGSIPDGRLRDLWSRHCIRKN